MHSPTSFLAAAAFLPAVFAHYNFEALIVNGNVTGAYEYVRQTNNSNSPITDITSTNMRCNSGGLLASTMAKTSTYTVAPGDNVGFTIDAAISHPGPLSVWMSKAPDGTTADEYDGSGDWFKIYELTTYEITSAGLQWATYIPGTSGIQNFTVDIPSELPAGDYLLRGEHIALHAAEEFEGAQYYIGCAQLSVTGSGSGSPSPVSSIPGQYTGYEAGLIIDIYYPIPTNYTAPGISTWPEACVSHWPNLIDQTYYGMCYNSTTAQNVTVSSDGSTSSSSSSGSTTTAAASSVASSSAVAATSSSVVATSSVATSSTVSTSSAAAVAAESSATSSAAPAATSTSSKTCSKKRKRSNKNNAQMA